VTKTQSAGPISCLEHRATRVLHCAKVTRATVLMFPLLLQTVISNQMRPQRLRGGLHVASAVDPTFNSRQCYLCRHLRCGPLDTALFRKNPPPEALRYGTRCQGISQFYLHTHEFIRERYELCICLPRRSLSSFAYPGQMEN